MKNQKDKLSWSAILDEFKDEPRPVLLTALALILAGHVAAWLGLIAAANAEVFCSGLDAGCIAVPLIWVAVRTTRRIGARLSKITVSL